MTDNSQISSSKLTEHELIAYAREAIGFLCGIKPEDVFVRDNGLIDFSAEGSSAVLYFYAEGEDADPACFWFRSILLHSVTDNSSVYQHLNRINASLMYGRMVYIEREIRLSHRLIVSHADTATLALVIGELHRIADTYDKSLKTLLGGERWLERAEDEIEV